MSIVVTAATGQLGHLVIAELLRRGVPAGEVVAAGRTLDKAADLVGQGVRTVFADYSDPDSLGKVFSAGDTVLLISGSEVGHRVRQHRNVIDAAAEAGVGRIAYTSVLSADDTPLVVAAEHLPTEEAVRASGLPFTLLRNGWYTENYGQAMKQAASTGVVVSSAGDGRVASATRADYAAATAAVLSTDGHAGKVYELSGDHAWSFDELAAAFATLLGREVALRRVSAEEHRQILSEAGVPDGVVGFVVTLDGNIRDGALASTPGDLSRLAGRPSTPLVEALRPLL